MDKFLIRKATIDDAYWIASVNANTRYTTYQWLMPQKVLETRLASIQETSEKIKENMQKSDSLFLVALNTENDEIIWMLYYGPSRNEKYPNDWEIYAFYVLQEYQKLGIGKKLFLAWVHELLNLWYNNMILNVLEWNNAIWFYQKFGWIVVWERFEPCGKIMIKENILFFDNIKNIK